MFKGGTNTGSLTKPHGINVSQSAYGKAVKLLYGLVQAQPDLIWYNDWRSSGKIVNAALASVTSQSSGGKKSGKTSKKSGVKYYSAAINLLLGHAPCAGILSAWYNNQKFAVVPCSASGFISGGQFSFTPLSGNSKATYTSTIPSSGPYTRTAPSFVSDLNLVTAAGVALSPVVSSPGAGQYSVNTSGVYTFNVAEAGKAVSIIYRKLTSGSAATLAGIYAVTLAETFSETFDDFGGPGSETFYGTWERPLWNARFAEPGNLSSSAYRARDPYTWWWDDSTPTINVPSALEGMPVTVYFGVPAIYRSDGSFFSGSLTPLELLNLEFEPACGGGAEYASFPAQQIVQDWVCGVGSVRFDLTAANAMPNLNLETIGAFTQWPNGDCDVADVIADIVASGPVRV